MNNDERFDQLLVMAMDGDECAPQDLWLEFGYVLLGSEAVAT